MAFLNRGLSITLSDERPDDERTEQAQVSYQYDGGIADFVRYINRSKDAVHDSVIEFGAEAMGISVEVAMQWSGSYAESVHTFANTINTVEGGTHEEGFRAALTTIVNRYAREQKLVKEKDEPLTGDDVREGLAAIIHVKLASRSSRARPRPSSATPWRSRSSSGPAMSTSATGSSAIPARPRRS